MKKIEKLPNTIRIPEISKVRETKDTITLKNLLILILKITQEMQINSGFQQQERMQINGSMNF